MIQQFYFWAYIQEKNAIQNDICTPVFIATLITQPLLQQPRHGSNLHVHQQMNGRCIYIQWNITPLLKKRMPFAATWMKLEVIILSEVSQTNISLIHGIKKRIQMNLFTKQTDLQTQKTNLQYPWGKDGGGINQFGINTTVYKIEDLLQSTGNST